MGEGYYNSRDTKYYNFEGKPVKLWEPADIDCYCSNDIASLNIESYISQKMYDAGYLKCPSAIKKVIFNGPATIVIWLDGTKTVVKCAEGDKYSKFAGLAIAICKHDLGPNFKKVFNYFIPKEETECHSSETTNSKQ